MKTLSVLLSGAALLTATFTAAFTASAQLAPGGAQAGMSSTLGKLFGQHTNFSAVADVRVLDPAQKETASLSMDFAVLDGNMRAEVDITKVKSKDLPPGAADGLKQMGMERVISLTRPDKKAVYIIYPGIQSYANMPLPKEELELLEKEPKIERTVLGKETVDGQPCVKTRIVVTMGEEKHEAIVWNATDLKDFPIQIQLKEKDDTVLLRYKQIKLAKPDSKLFEPPKGYTEYEDVQQMMFGAMQKMFKDGAR